MSQNDDQFMAQHENSMDNFHGDSCGSLKIPKLHFWGWIKSFSIK